MPKADQQRYNIKEKWQRFYGKVYIEKLFQSDYVKRFFEIFFNILLSVDNLENGAPHPVGTLLRIRCKKCGSEQCKRAFKTLLKWVCEGYGFRNYELNGDLISGFKDAKQAIRDKIMAEQVDSAQEVETWFACDQVN